MVKYYSKNISHFILNYLYSSFTNTFGAFVYMLLLIIYSICPKVKEFV